MCILITPRFLTEDWFLIALTKKKKKNGEITSEVSGKQAPPCFSCWFLQHNNSFYFARIKISLYSNSFISSFQLFFLSFPYIRFIWLASHLLSRFILDLWVVSNNRVLSLQETRAGYMQVPQRSSTLSPAHCAASVISKLHLQGVSWQKSPTTLSSEVNSESKGFQFKSTQESWSCSFLVAKWMSLDKECKYSCEQAVLR